MNGTGLHLSWSRDGAQGVHHGLLALVRHPAQAPNWPSPLPPAAAVTASPPLSSDPAGEGGREGEREREREREIERERERERVTPSAA